MSIEARFVSSTDAKRAGWFSRRHQTAGSHRDAQDQRAKQEEEKAQREFAQRTRTLLSTKEDK